MSFAGNMSKAFQVHKRKLYVAGGLAGLVTLQYTNLNPFGASLKTPGVGSIEDRFSSGGGTKNHTPGVATPRGSYDQVEPRTEKSKGVGTDHFEDKVAGQKPDPSGFDKAWNKMNYGKEKGK
ncbi:hypothetical protein MMC09_004335 [Bachmanniomyces sp. S44760]|nr:hypothetical protein [Bachmanniomyces sp. S44760]